MDVLRRHQIASGVTLLLSALGDESMEGATSLGLRATMGGRRARVEGFGPPVLGASCSSHGPWTVFVYFFSHIILWTSQSCYRRLSSSPLPSLHDIICPEEKLSVQFSSVTQSCPTLCDSTNHSMPGLPVQHQLLEFTQTHVHQVGDTIQPSHPLSSPSSPAPNPSQHQGLFQ